MTAALEAVDADGVAADLLGLEGMANRRAFVNHLDAGFLQRRQQFGGTLRQTGDDAESAGVRCRRRKLRKADIVHPTLDNRMLDLEQVSDRCSHEDPRHRLEGFFKSPSHRVGEITYRRRGSQPSINDDLCELKVVRSDGCVVGKKNILIVAVQAGMNLPLRRVELRKRRTIRGRAEAVKLEQISGAVVAHEI